MHYSYGPISRCRSLKNDTHIPETTSEFEGRIIPTNAILKKEEERRRRRRKRRRRAYKMVQCRKKLSETEK